MIGAEIARVESIARSLADKNTDEKTNHIENEKLDPARECEEPARGARGHGRAAYAVGGVAQVGRQGKIAIPGPALKLPAGVFQRVGILQQNVENLHKG